ncbi:MAG: TRAP transporter large permease [Proteobacteria bacterium]|uniref:TRAP transporter large permease protein n=1 Tax=Candidatus Avisuccinivibrio stercorigallinarum TaxID=2840704 RepID=A0A9D9GU05_9GAMM|nr:TRAP transporter large permease [Candidatus Avisuccinivibrio stercorigallinarum]
MLALILFGMFFLLLLLNVPIALSLGISSVCALLYDALPLAIIPNNLYSATSKFVLLAIPFFILAGNIMEKAGISKQLIDFCRTLVGHRRSGMAEVCVIVSCFFAAISGSGPATVAALGLIIIPAMVNAGYDKSTSTALMSTTGAIGLIIPPSIAFVIYGSITGQSVGALFASGILPGILLGVVLLFTMQFVSRKRELKVMPKATWAERKTAFVKAFGGLLMPVIILGGIYGGIFTPTEAAAVAAVYGLALGLITRNLKLKDIMPVLRDSVSQTAVVMFIVATSSLFAWALTVTGVAQEASALLLSMSGDNPIIFLLIINVILLIAGCFIDANSAQYIIIPILFPVSQVLGIDPIHLGCVIVMNLSIGLVTPPVGINLYVGCGISGTSLKEISRAVVPFVITSILTLLLITYIPILSTWLPSILV